MPITLPALGTLLLALPAAAATLQPLTKEHHVWAMSEFAVTGVPRGENPYDPDAIAVDVTFTGPSGKSVILPAFWYQGYTRALVQEETIPTKGADAGKKVTVETEKLAPAGEPGWRVRFTPLEAGAHHWKLVVAERGRQTLSVEGELSVGPNLPGAHGFVRVEPREKRYFMRDDGTPLPLLGECACWHGPRGTFDYDDWFGAFAKAGMNYSRLWMWQNAFGIEVLSGERLNYNQERAWRLDHVMDLAARDGIALMLCLDYHGVFQVDPDMWGGNNLWPQHPYNAANGGPCATQNDFFTSEAARALYRKRLRYLVGRYAAEPSLMSWQFFNEISNVFRYLKPPDVVAWHDEMARRLKATDPYQHLVTTSFGSAGEHPEMWKLESLDYAQYHLYLNWSGGYRQPALMAADVAQRFHEKYDKPVYVGEFGTSGAGWKPEIDPHFRGLRQGLWGGILGGSAGTVMPWWWQYIHSDSLYGLWASLGKFLAGTGFGSAAWHPAEVSAPHGGTQLGDPLPGAAPFTATIKLAGKWGDKPSGLLTLGRPSDAEDAPLHPFLHGTGKRDLAVPCIITAVLGEGAHLVAHVNSVSNGAVFAVRASGKEIFRRDLPNKDGRTEICGEYDEDVAIPLPAGRQEIELHNPGGDWLYLDSIRVEGVLPAARRNEAGIPLDVMGMTDGRMALVWAIDPRFNYPKGATTDAEEVKGAVVTLHGLPDGEYTAEWWHTGEGRALGSTKAICRGGRMELPVVPFSVDVAARVTPAGR